MGISILNYYSWNLVFSQHRHISMHTCFSIWWNSYMSYQYFHSILIENFKIKEIILKYKACKNKWLRISRNHEKHFTSTLLSSSFNISSNLKAFSSALSVSSIASFSLLERLAFFSLRSFKLNKMTEIKCRLPGQSCQKEAANLTEQLPQSKIQPMISKALIFYPPPFKNKDYQEYFA